VLVIPGCADPFHHVDRNTLSRVGPATPNPLAAQARTGDLSLGIGSLRT
jgi:hypothetical protein